jgi:hypothetical protein
VGAGDADADTVEPGPGGGGEQLGGTDVEHRAGGQHERHDCTVRSGEAA